MDDETTVHSFEEGEKHRTFKKKPEFIIIDSTKDYIDSSWESWESKEEPEVEFTPQRKPLSLRFFCFLGLVLSLLMALFLLSALLVVFCLSAVCLFKNVYFNQFSSLFWSSFTNSIVFALGFAIAIFSTALGLGLIMLHFSLLKNDRNRNNDIFKAFLKKIIS